MVDLIVTVLGGLVLMLGLASKWLEKSPFPPTLLALVIGIILGPEILAIIDPEELGKRTSILETAARLTLGIGLVSVALRIPKEFIRRQWRKLFLFIACTTLLMWGISAALVYLLLGLPFWMAALIGAIVAPTDPIAATPIVTGELAQKNIPEEVRHTISFESGANDGLSYLIVFLPFLMLTKAPEQALSHWLMHTLLWEVFVATAVGLVLGWAAGKLLTIVERRNLIQESWRLVYTVALALLAVGTGKLIHSDEVLLVFAAGVAFTQIVSGKDRGNEEKGQEAVNRFFSIPIFALLGTAIPWAGWRELGWSGLLLAVAILFLRRPPILLPLRRLIPVHQKAKDAFFVGWFGPIAVAAIYYASMMEHRLSEPLIWEIVSLIICTSVVAHGLTASWLTRLYGAAKQKE